MKRPSPREIFARFRAFLGRLHPLVILATAWLVLVVYAYPGQLTQDPIDHLTEARRGFYTDAHPPAINLLWRAVDYFIAGPFGILVLQTTMLLAGFYLLLRRALTVRGATWFAAAAFLFPPIALPMAIIWKDCIMAGALALGAAALWSQRRGLRLAGLGLLFVATAVRYNAFAATFALVVLVFEWSPGMRWWQRYPIAIAAWLAITIAAFSLNERLTDRPMYYWNTSIAVHDIVGTLHYLDEDLPDAEVLALVEGTGIRVTTGVHAAMRASYSHRHFIGLIAGDRPTALWDLPTGGEVPPTYATRDALAAAWKRVVFRYPWAYAKHRLAVTAGFLSFGNNRVAGIVPPRMLKYPGVAKNLGLATDPSRFQVWLTDGAHWAVKWIPIFRPWMYLVLALALLWIARTHRDVFALLLSGLGLESTYILLAPSADYRYSHWMIICVVLSVILLVARRLRRT